jgi:tripartite-type tricarboxylate transporter receptor subunit TctC
MKKLAIHSLFALLAGALGGAPAVAQDYPTKAVKIVVPFPAGGGTDTMARMVALGLQQALGQPFVVDNKPGAGGNIGIDAVAKAPNDGYTLLMVTNNIAINPSLYGKVSYHPIRDFAPIALVGSSPVAISVNNALGIGNLADLLRYAKANPGKLSYASCGSGTPQHLAAELLMDTAKTEMNHVPYKGCAQPMTDHLSGLVPISFSTVANLAPHLKTGKIKAVAVTGARRSTFAPDLPTVSEAANLPGYDLDVWFGLFAPAGTPSAVIARVNEIVNKQLATAEIRQKMTEQNYDVLGGTPQALANAVARDIPRYEKIIRSANIKAD